MRAGNVRRNRQRSQNGFALIEVLIAATISLAVTVMLVQGVSLAFQTDRRTENNRREIRIAQSRLEAAGIEHRLSFGQSEGEAGGQSWQQSAYPAKPFISGRPMDGNRAKPRVELYWVEVTVPSQSGRETRLSASKIVVGAP